MLYESWEWPWKAPESNGKMLSTIFFSITETNYFSKIAFQIGY